jgi:hypothetical protein
MPDSHILIGPTGKSSKWLTEKIRVIGQIHMIFKLIRLWSRAITHAWYGNAIPLKDEIGISGSRKVESSYAYI